MKIINWININLLPFLEIKTYIPKKDILMTKQEYKYITIGREGVDYTREFYKGGEIYRGDRI